MSQYLEAPRPPTPPRAAARLKGRPEASKPVGIPGSERKVSFRTPGNPPKAPQDVSCKGKTAKADYPWECCECRSMNSQFEFDCSVCRVHGKCKDCDELELGEFEMV